MRRYHLIMSALFGMSLGVLAELTPQRHPRKHRPWRRCQEWREFGFGAGAVGSACLTALAERGYAREIVVVNRARCRIDKDRIQPVLSENAAD